MAEDSDGTLTAVVICEGNLHDPDFPDKLNEIVGKLQSLVEESESSKLKVNKVRNCKKKIKSNFALPNCKKKTN
jgi:hypothetical protein